MNHLLIGTFTLFVYKSLIIVVENFQKYHWIQHKQTQPVVALSEFLIEPSEGEIYSNTIFLKYFFDKQIFVGLVSQKLLELEI